MNELSVANFAQGALEERVGQSFIGRTPKDKKEAVTTYNAVNNGGKRLGDCINTVIEFDNFYVEWVQCNPTESSPEGSIAPRTVLMNGKETYQCCSTGVYQSLCKLASILIPASEWTTPVKVKVLQKTVSGSVNKITTLELVDPGDNLDL